MGSLLVQTGPVSAGYAYRPCDIYGLTGTPCVAAYSSVRALYDNYAGPLYQVTRRSDNLSYNVGVLTVGGYANAASQDTFCGPSSCTITRIYDQSGNGNDLVVQGAGPAGGPNVAARANALPITVAGNRVYGIYLPPGTGYRRTNTSQNNYGNVPRGDAPQSVYEVASGTNVNNGCCSSFGNTEQQIVDNLAGAMDTVNVSLMNAPTGVGYGPWVQADLEEGVFRGYTTTNDNNTPVPYKFVTAVEKNDGKTTFALKGGNSQTGVLKTMYSGPLPAAPPPGQQPGSYTPMRKEGSVVLGVGGDNSNRGTQSFFEGALMSGYSTDVADNGVQTDIVGVGYTGYSSGGGPGSPIIGPGGKCVDVDGFDTGGNLSAVQLWDCAALAADQRWSPSAIGKGTLATLGRCLDIAGNSSANGAQVDLYDCNGVGGQQWVPQANGSILNPQSGRCLDSPNGNTANGTRLQIWDCNGGAAQKFRINDGVPIVGPGNQRCVDVAGTDTGGNGTPVQMWDCYTLLTQKPFAVDQQWRFSSDQLNTDQTLRTLGRCLEVAGNSTVIFAKVQLYDCNGTGGQKWMPTADGQLLNPQSGLCLRDPGAGSTNGIQLIIHKCGSLGGFFKMNGNYPNAPY